MNNPIGRAALNHPCPSCKNPVKFTLDDVNLHKSITCKNCNTTISLVDQNSTIQKTVRNAERDIADIKKRLNRTITFKI